MSDHSAARVLVVEDELAMGQDIVRRLGGYGYQASLASCPDGLEEALELGQDLILGDIDGGQEALDRLDGAARRRGIPLIVMTKTLDEGLLDRVVASCAVKLFLIPFKENAIRIGIELALAARSPDRDFPCGLEAGGEGVLIIEDEKIIALDMARRIEGFGFKVLGMAPSVDEGLSMAETLRPGLVTTGICLKGFKSGIEGATTLRNRYSIPLIYVTAYADEATLDRVKLTRPDDYLIKQWKDHELYASLRIALARQAGKRQAEDPRGIFAAARRGGGSELAAALARGADPKARDPGGKTPLMYAAALNEDAACLEALLDAGAEIDATDAEGMSALMHALSGPSREACRVLLGRGASVRLRDSRGRGILDLWLARGSVPIDLGPLCKAGLDPRGPLADGRHPVQAILADHSCHGQRKLEDYFGVLRGLGLSVSDTGLPGPAAQTLAVVADLSPSCLEALLAEGLDPESRDGSSRTALWLAVEEGSARAVRALLDCGADPVATGVDGLVPLSMTWARGTDSSAYFLGMAAEVAKLLVEAGGMPDRRALGRPSAAGLAIFAETFPDLLPGLVAGNEVDLLDGNGRTGLFHAVEAGWEQAIECLLSLGADPLLHGPEAMSALEYAEAHAWSVSPSALELLQSAAAGSDPKASGQGGPEAGR